MNLRICLVGALFCAACGSASSDSCPEVAANAHPPAYANQLISWTYAPFAGDALSSMQLTVSSGGAAVCSQVYYGGQDPNVTAQFQVDANTLTGLRQKTIAAQPTTWATSYTCGNTNSDPSGSQVDVQIDGRDFKTQVVSRAGSVPPELQTVLATLNYISASCAP